ncbi:transcriptional regulator SUPERMAN [Manihot esculenta]|uniref:C2H2-type domain-containing protein n=1 Tax=Manihot esculenta TaxID=3983 RepID=A0A251LBF8_MANES|nr:transcriptional regulator SUPERMAN [Manihot esculenta]OAY55615.1 hypothetical protein MANES_03G167600v8 [Manihot esculenta]OAY55616.1 hypothetical protein MANES_03G167600v8 [Manihot esculenta]
MERNSLSNSLKDHSIGSRASSSSNNNSQNNKNKLKYSWNYNNQSCGEDYLSGFSWPPRSYTCSFCKREFRSAQALGGHMNVHRRDRARLRQSPARDGQCPILNLNVNLNPNPSFSPPVTSTFPSSAPPLSALSSPSFASSSETKKWAIDDSPFLDPLSPKSSDLTKIGTGKALFDAEEFDGFTREDGCKLSKKAEIIRLDLEIGLLSESKEDLDLELRLGYS